MKIRLVAFGLLAFAGGLAVGLSAGGDPPPVPFNHVVVHKHPVITYVGPTTTTTTSTTVPVDPSGPVVQAAPAPTAKSVPVAAAPPTTTTTTVPPKLSFLAEAQSQIGMVNPPYSDGGFWCWKFVNFVGDNSNVQGWVDATGPGDFLSYPVDPNGPQPGDIVVYGDPTQNQQPIHVGIVETVNGDGTFTAIEGNGDSATTVIETTRPITGVSTDGLDVLEFVLP